jgi:hypothetical protein
VHYLCENSDSLIWLVWELFQQLLFLVELFLKQKQLFPGAGGDVPKAGEALPVAVGDVPGGAVYEVAARSSCRGRCSDVPKAGEALPVAKGAVPIGAVHEVAALPGDVPIFVKLTKVFFRLAEHFPKLYIIVQHTVFVNRILFCRET